MILFVQRCGVKKHFIATYIITAITVVWGLAAFILIAVPCEATMPWNSLDSTCSSLVSLILSIRLRAPNTFLVH